METFASASSSVNFIVVISFQLSLARSILPFDLTNGFTHEQLTLKKTANICCFVLIRSPIARDESKWTKWVEEAIGWQISKKWQIFDFGIYNEEDIGDGVGSGRRGGQREHKNGHNHRPEFQRKFGVHRGGPQQWPIALNRRNHRPARPCGASFSAKHLGSLVLEGRPQQELNRLLEESVHI
ncbi:hypothetical protein niasHT_017387 [Heterodera trifolii]|uniref:Uncharacterized protein n=1 Tax=Heterodera trifolii TaxID=157864 RepID=A0ABD2KYE0_9BILA